MNKRMWNRVLAISLSAALVFGMIRTPVTAYAAGDEASLEVSAEAETLVETQEADVDAEADGEDSFVPEEQDAEEKEVSTFTIKTVKIEAGFGLAEEDEDAEDISRKLDELFKPELKVDDVAYAVGGRDEAGFTASYKFVVIPDSEDITGDDEEYLEALTLPVSDEEFKLIESAELSEIPAGARVLVYAMATTAQGKEYFAANIAYIVEPEDTDAEVDEDAEDEDAATEEDSSDEAAALSSDAEDAAAEASSEEADAAAEASSEEEALEEAAGEDETVAAGEASTEEELPEENADEETLVGSGPTGVSYAIGFYDNLVAFDTPASAAGCIAELYITEVKDGKNTKNTWKLGERELLNPDDFSGEGWLKNYLKANSIAIESGTVPAGVYALTARYHLDPANPQNVTRVTEENDRIMLNVYPTPEVEVTPATGSAKKGTLNIAAENIPAYYSMATLIKDSVDSTPEKFTSNGGNLYAYVYAGHYRVSLDAVPTTDFALGYYDTTVWTDVYVPVVESLSSIAILRNGEISGSSFETYIGATSQLSVAFTPSTYENDRVTWSSGNPTVAVIDPDTGVLTAMAPGTAAITATPLGDGTKAKTVTCTVKDEGMSAPYNTKVFKADKTKVTLSPEESCVITITGDKKLGDLKAGVACFVSDTKTVSVETVDSKFSSDGEYRFTVKATTPTGSRPGSAVVTVCLRGYNPNPVKEKSLSITVNVDGFSKDAERAFKGGKNLTGWVNANMSNAITSYGKPDNDDTTYTYYIDPATNKLAKGAYKIGKKLYLFRSSGSLYKDFTRTYDKYACSESLYTGSDYCVAKDGSLHTGWVVPGNYPDREYYYSTVDGKKVTQYWVKKGKGYTYVDENGISAGITDGKNTVTILENDYTYCFRGGVVQTGFVYEDKDGNLFAKANNAKYAYYFDPGDGGKMVTGFFFVKGKKYYANPTNGKISINCQFDTTVEDGSVPYFADKTGAIVMNKLVTDSYGAQYYAGSDGVLVKNKTVIINGRECYFGNNLQLQAQSLQELELKFKIANNYISLYSGSANPGKPSEGLAYYIDSAGKEKAKNGWVYSASYKKVAYLDKNSRKVTGLQKIDGKLYYFDTDGSYNESRTGFIKVGSKYVYIDSDGVVCNTTGFVMLSTTLFIYVKDKNGTLATGLSTIGGKKYLFEDAGEMILPGSSSHMLNGVYYCNRSGRPENAGDAKNFYIVTGKIRKVQSGSVSVVIGKDGMLYSGMYSESGKKYLYFVGSTGSANTYVVSGGKAYYIGNEGFAVGGWHKCTGGFDFDTFNRIDMGENPLYFYFDPKSFTTVSGWKSVKAPVFDGNGNIVENASGEILTQNTTKKLYFNETASAGLPKGALIRNTDMTIKGKLYRFGADGSVKANAEGKAFVDESISIYKDAYLKKDGTLATGRTAITSNGVTGYYYFSPRTYQAEKNVFRKTGSKWYYYGANGKCVTGGALIAETRSNYYAKAVFNKDGSINGFVYDGIGTRIKNELISLDPSGDMNTDYYILGSNGLPVTGLYNVPDHLLGIFKGNKKLNIQSDGFLAFDYSAESYLRMEKIGSRYYLTNNGAILVNGDVSYDLDTIDYSYLPVADRDAIDRYISIAKGMIGSGITVFPDKDGSLSKRTLTLTTLGYTIHTNKYGIANETLSMFSKGGSNWYVSENITFFAILAGNSYVDMQLDPVSAEDITARIHFDRTYKITSITYVVEGIDTGVAVDGVFSFDGADPDGAGELEPPTFLLNISKGKLATGKKTIGVDEGLMKITLYFDPDLAIATAPTGIS